MDHRAIMQKSIDYIEDNLKAEITGEELAQMAGFSLYHYCRLFRAATGMTPQHYILRRRLLHGIYAVARGSSGIDAALSYGFDTYAGFYRAFVREFGCTPSAYVGSDRAKKPWRIDLTKEEHRMMTHKTAARVLKHWGQENEKLTDVLVESSGAQRENIVAVGAEHLLKCTCDLGKLKNHIALSKKLVAMGLGAAVPVPTLDGREILADGECWYILTRRLPGRTLTARELLEPETAKRTGAAIGALHRALDAVEAPVEDAELLSTLRTWAIPAAKGALDLTEGWCRGYLEELEKLWPELPRQIIHRDPNPGNLVWDGDRCGFLDFELSQRNVRIYDIVYAATAVLSETFKDGTEKWLDCYRALLAGYDTVAELTEAERQAIPYVLIANQLVCVAWFSGEEKYRELFETNKRMTHWLLARFEEGNM